MNDLSKFSTIQLLMFNAVAEFECSNLESCDVCPFYTNNHECASLKVKEFIDRKERT